MIGPAQNDMSGMVVSRVLRLAFAVFLFSSSGGHGQEIVSLDELPGVKIDRQWFRYTNQRFGLAIDIPTKGYRYHTPVNGSGLTLISEDEEDKQVTITIHTHWVMNLFGDANNNAEASIKHLLDEEAARTKAEGGTVTYSVRRKQFYVISGYFGDKTYYERMTISPQCPAIFHNVRIFGPKAREREIDKLVARLSLSLRATCRGAEGAAKI